MCSRTVLRLHLLVMSINQNLEFMYMEVDVTCYYYLFDDLTQQVQVELMNMYMTHFVIFHKLLINISF